MSAAPRALAPAHRPWRRRDLAAELRELRERAQARYSEADLLVAALRDHIRDLQIERDRLLAELARLRDEARRANATWLWRGSKQNRQ
ncbi:MAG: hypothetical protein ACM3S1_11355 [Hyphomicrobiales bacterium]